MQVPDSWDHGAASAAAAQAVSDASIADSSVSDPPTVAAPGASCTTVSWPGSAEKQIPDVVSTTTPCGPVTAHDSSGIVDMAGTGASPDADTSTSAVSAGDTVADVIQASLDFLAAEVAASSTDDALAGAVPDDDAESAAIVPAVYSAGVPTSLGATAANLTEVSASPIATAANSPGLDADTSPNAAASLTAPAANSPGTAAHSHPDATAASIVAPGSCLDPTAAIAVTVRAGTTAPCTANFLAPADVAGPPNNGAIDAVANWMYSSAGMVAGICQGVRNVLCR